MRILVRAVISGFGFSLGAALFKRVSAKLGLDDDAAAKQAAADKTTERAGDDAETGEGRAPALD
jgi:hypothetical protein